MNLSISSLAVITNDHTLYDDTGQMVTDVLNRMHIRTQLFQKCIAGVENFQAVMIIGDVSLLEKYETFFRGLGNRKPLILFWYLEPLGPARMSFAAKHIAKKLASCFWPNVLPLGLSRFFHPADAGRKPKTNYIINRMRDYYGWRLKRRIVREGGYDCRNLDSRDLYWMAFRAEQFRRHFENPYVDLLFTSTPSRQQHLENDGIFSTVVPVGWHPTWGHKLNIQRDIDIVFLGHLRKKDDRRARVIAAAQKQLAAAKYSITVIDKDCFGQQRTELLNRTKILLDVVRTPWEIPGMRLLIGIGCGALTVSCGFVGDAGRYQEGLHFVNASPKTLVHTLLFYLRNDNCRQEIIDKGQRLLHEKLTMEHSLQTIISEAVSYLQKKSPINKIV